MQLNEAQKLFSRAYVDREDKEVPLMQKLVTFNDKSVLEITQEKSTVKPWLSKKYAKYVEIKPENLGAEQREFDIVFTRWTTPYFEDLTQAITKICSLAKQSVLIVIPSEQGELTKLKMLKDSETASRRRKRAFDIEQTMKECGFSTVAIPALLKFSFASYDEAVDVLMATEFNNSISHSELQQFQDFLSSKKKRNKKIEIMQGAMFIAGSKK